MCYVYIYFFFFFGGGGVEAKYQRNLMDQLLHFIAMFNLRNSTSVQFVSAFFGLMKTKGHV